MVSLAQAGATVVDMQVAGRWKSSQMPAHYAKAELAERGRLRGSRMVRRGSRPKQEPWVHIALIVAVRDRGGF